MADPKDPKPKKARAGQIYRGGKRHFRIAQVRGGSPGLSYALLNLCTPDGTVIPHPQLAHGDGSGYITSYLSPDGILTGYELQEETR